MKVQHFTDSIWTIENFLSQKECDELIIFSEQKGYEEATISLTSGAKMMKGIRNNYRLIHLDINLANVYWERLAQFCPKEIYNNKVIGLNEQFRFYKYEPEQRFKRHIDGRFKRNKLEESLICRACPWSHVDADQHGLSRKIDGGKTLQCGSSFTHRIYPLF